MPFQTISNVDFWYFFTLHTFSFSVVTSGTIKDWSQTGYAKALNGTVKQYIQQLVNTYGGHLFCYVRPSTWNAVPGI